MEASLHFLFKKDQNEEFQYLNRAKILKKSRRIPESQGILIEFYHY
jgi:hypothetical protein